MPTEVGLIVAQHSEVMVEASRAAFAAARHASARPVGRLRISCPPGVGNFFLASLLPVFHARYPEIHMEFDMTNRQVDVIAEGYDIAFRVRSRVEDSTLVIRDFGASEQVLVASKAFCLEHGPFDSIESLANVQAGGRLIKGGRKPEWRLIGSDGSRTSVPYAPSFETDDVLLLTQMATSGRFVAQVPFNACEQPLADGRLHLLLPSYRVHPPRLLAVMPSRRFMAPATRVFLDFLGDALVEETDRASRRLRELREPGSR